MVIPYIHPIVVHFPIALLIVSVVFALGWLASGAAWWRNSLLILTLLGAASSLVAVQSGEEVADAIAFQGGWGDRQELKNEHEELGEIALIASFGTSIFLLAVFALGVTKRRERDPVVVRVIGLLACLACATAVGMAGHKGGLLVWGEEPDATPAAE